MRIGEVARELGVPTHVLRHWEDAGALSPARTAGGYREFDREQVTRARIVQRCREVGLALPLIVRLLHRGSEGRESMLREQLAGVGVRLRELEHTQAFLEHVIDCRHDLMSRCHGCGGYADPLNRG